MKNLKLKFWIKLLCVKQSFSIVAKFTGVWYETVLEEQGDDHLSRQIPFCETMFEKLEQYPDLSTINYFTDECIFFSNRHVNK